MRTSTRSLRNRASGYAPQRGTGFQVPRAVNDNWGAARSGRSPIPSSVAPAIDRGLAALEDRLAKRLGFPRGRQDPRWAQAKRMLRQGKAALNALEALFDAVSSQLHQAHGHRNWLGSFGLCTYATGNSGSVGRPDWSGINPQCLQGQSNGGNQPHNGPITANEAANGRAQYVGPDTNPFLPGPWQITENLLIPGRAAGSYLGTVPVSTRNPFQMIDPLISTRPGQPTALQAPRPIPYRLLPRLNYELGRTTLEANYRSFGKEGLRKAPATAPAPFAQTIVISRTGVAVQPAVWARPRGPVREKKSAVTSGLAGVAMNAVTETGDFLDSLYWALPARITSREYARRKGKPPIFQDKLALILRYGNEIDVNKALNNLFWNEVEDRVIGTLSSKANKAANRHMGRRPVGITFGPAL